MNRSSLVAPLALPLLASLLACAGCALDDLAQVGRFCSGVYPCSAGLTCDPVSSRCVQTADADAAPPRDVAADQIRDAAPIQDHGPGAEGGTDHGLDTGGKLDTGPQPDANCTGGTISCNGGCVDPLVNFQHCGDCNKPCPGAADRCQNGKCHCGDFKPLCAGDLNCVSGACACVTGAGSLCAGCCQGSAVCQAGTTPGFCGLGGVSCKICSTTSACLAPTCLGGLCGSTPHPDGLLCPGGRCYTGACCTGCWDAVGKVCRSGTSPIYCGAGGQFCADCKALQKACISQSCQ